jgi:hypothetical protein
MHFRVESLGERSTSHGAKPTEYRTGTVRVESGHVMKALFFHPTTVLENSFYYRGKGSRGCLVHIDQIRHQRVCNGSSDDVGFSLFL